MRHFRSEKLILPLLGTMLLLSGCGEVNNDAPGFYKYLAIPTTSILNGLAHIGGYGVALIILTVIIRLILIPVSMYQTRNTTFHQFKLRPIKPQVDKLKDRRINAPNRADRAKAAKDIQALYKKYHISSTGGVGCLPLIVQILIFMSLYSAIKYSNALFHTQFFGINLGSHNFFIPIIAFLAYLVQIYISTRRMGKKKQGLWAMFVSPTIILLVSWGSPAGIGIYFVVCGIFACIQAHITNIYQARLNRKIENHEIELDTADSDTLRDIKEDVEPTMDDIMSNDRSAGPDKGSPSDDDKKDKEKNDKE